MSLNSAVNSLFRRQLASAGVFDQVIRRRAFEGVVVLAYHGIRIDAADEGAMPFEPLHVRAPVFEAHCRTIRRLCHPISMDQWRCACAGGEPLPARSVLVTFDDGYRSVLTEALPILRRFSIPAVVFICSDPVARGEMFWYDAVAYSRGEAAVSALKEGSHATWLAEFSAIRRPVDPEHPAAPLSPDEIRTLAADPLIEIGAHSHRHPILGRADADTQREEIVTNLDALEAWTGRRPRAFAYPNGRAGLDFTDTTASMARDAGLDQAFTTDERMAPVHGNPMARPRFTATEGWSVDQLLYRFAWAWH